MKYLLLLFVSSNTEGEQVTSMTSQQTMEIYNDLTRGIKTNNSCMMKMTNDKILKDRIYQ
jgi:hypothetical protein